MQNIKLNIAGMTCVNCSNAIERVTKKIAGVLDAKVSFANGSGEFIIENAEVQAAIEEKIKKLGYGVAKDLAEFEAKREKHILNLRRNFLAAAALSAVIMALEMSEQPSVAKSAIMLALAFITIATCGRDFFIHAYGALKNKNFDMNVLVALGTSTAFAYSLGVFIAGERLPENMRYLYVSGAAMITAFVLLGKFLEERSKARAGDYIKSLMDMSPKAALVLQKDGSALEVDAASLKIGDIAVVKSGYAVPCDGVVINGGAEIDASMLTGESLPVYKKQGDEVNAGTINLNGYINVKVTKLANQTLLSQILELLSDASSKKMPISRFADRVANIFVPSVIAIAVVTFFTWFAITGNALQGVLSAVCVLIISCPCALGLATPIAIVSSLSLGAKNGILIKNPEVLEVLGGVKYAVFDKTGTLTKGEISVNFTDINDENLAKIAALEAKSSHPISASIVRYANELGLKILGDEKGFENIAARGVRAKFDGINLAGGSEKFMRELGLYNGEAVRETCYFFAVGGEIAAVFELEESLKEGAKECVDALKNAGMRVAMLTGDNEYAAKRVAEGLGVGETVANALPTDKAAYVERLAQQGRNVLMVGDGINDAAALALSSVAVCMGSGAAVSIAKSDIVLMRDDPASLAAAVALARRTYRIVRQNLAFSLVYNAVTIPLAMAGYVAPAVAALSMSLSSVAVVLNAMRAGSER